MDAQTLKEANELSNQITKWLDFIEYLEMRDGASDVILTVLRGEGVAPRWPAGTREELAELIIGFLLGECHKNEKTLQDKFDRL